MRFSNFSNAPALPFAQKPPPWLITRSGLRLAFAVAAIFVFMVSPSQAANFSWGVLSGDWSAAGNWGGVAPSSTDEAYIINGGTAAVTNLDSGAASALANDLFLGDPNSANSGAVQMSGGTLTVANNENLGSSGAGTFIQTGGTNTVGITSGFGALSLGSSGAYTLSNSGVLVANGESVGNFGGGVFTQSGGTNVVTNYLQLNGGTYNLNGGVLNVASIGTAAGGTLNVSGGTVTASTAFTTTQPITLIGNGYFNTCGTLTSATSPVTLAGALSGTAGLNVVGGGALQLAASNSYTGNITVSGAGTTLVLFNAAAVPNSIVTLSAGSGLQLNTDVGTTPTFNLAGLTGSGTGSLTDTFGSYAATLSIGGNGASSTFGGTLGGIGGLAQAGSGTFVLFGGNTYTGATSVTAGVLKLDFSQAGAPTNGILYNAGNASSLVMGGGTFAIQGKASSTNNQSLGGLTLNPGASAIVLTANVSNQLLLSMGNITRNPGGTVDFTPPAGAQTASNGIQTSAPLTNGILGGYATTGGTTWATLGGGSGTEILPYTAYANGDLGTLSPSATNVLPTGAQSTITSARSFNSLNLTLGEGVSMTGAGSLTLASGGLIGNTTGMITGGSLEGSSGTTGTPAELIVITPQNLTIGSVIVDNGGASMLTKSGSAMLTLTGNNTYSGGTTISAGTVQVSGNGSLGLTSGTATVNDLSVLLFKLSGNQTFAGAIAGIGTLTQAGPGLLALSGSNTYTGNTIVSAGTLQVGNGGSGEFLGSPIVSLSSNVSLSFSHSDALTYAGSIIGNGNLVKSGTGTLTLLGSNTYSGSTTISAGTIQIGNGFIPGTIGTGPLVDNGGLVFDLPGNVVFGGAVSGSGNLTQAGAGLLNFTGSSTLSGGATISSGTLEVSGAGSLGSGPVTDLGTLSFNLSGAPTFNGAINGSGNLVQAGTGILTLTASNTYTGGATISVGTLQVSGTGALGTGTVVNNGQLLFTASGNPTVPGAISGSGSLVQAGTGTLTLTANNSYNGGTTVSAGTLQVGNGGSGEFLASPSVSLSDSTALVFNESDSPIYSGSISGNGSLTQTGAGSVTLTGSNTYTGGTTVSAGTLQVGNGGSGEFLASPSVSLGNSASLVFSQSDSLVYSGAITGGGNLTQAGPGLLILNGSSNSYTGGTTISGGTLQVGDGTLAGALGASPGTVNDNGLLVFNNPTDTTFAGAISGFGNLTQAGTGVLTLLGSNTLSGIAEIDSGTLQVGNGGAGASIGGASSVLDNGSLVFNHSDSVTFAPAISGSGSLTQTGTSVLILLGDNSYTGSTTVSAGTLQVGNGGRGEFLNSPSVGLGSDTWLVFNHADALEFDGSISGSGSLMKSGSGLLTLAGSNTYTGGTFVSAGSIQIGNGGSGEFLGSPTVSLAASTALAFSQSDTMTYSGAVSGSGNLTQLGPGLLVLNGSSNSYTGGTTISGGTLQVGDGTLVGALGPGPVSNNGVLVFDLPGAATTFSGAVSGIGSLTQAGAGVLTLLGSNTFTGGTTVSSGTIQIGNGGTTGALTGNVDIEDGQALVLDRSGTMNFTLSGPGTLSNIGSGTTTLTGNSSGFAGSVSVVQGQLVVAGPIGLGGMSVVGSNATLQFRGATVNLGTAFGFLQAQSGGTVQYQNEVVIGGNLFGPGTQVLAASSNNTFNNVTINAGTPLLQNGPATFNGVTNYGQITGSGGLTLFGGQNDGSISLSGANNVSAWGNDLGQLTIQSGGLLNNHLSNLTVSGGGQITINSGGTLNADPNGQGLSLNLQGGLLINEGAVVGTTNANYGATVTGSGAFPLVNLSYGGTLDLISQNANVTVLNGVGTVNHSGTGRNTLTVSSGDLTGTIENTAGQLVLLKSGNGQLILGGDNTFSGGAFDESGTLELARSSALLEGSSLFVGAQAALLLDQFADSPITSSLAVTAAPSAVASVPEPAAFTLLCAAAFAAAAGISRAKKRILRQP